MQEIVNKKFSYMSKKNYIYSIVSGGLEQSFYNALSIGCRSFAFFVRNQRSWNSPPMKDEVVQKFRQTAKVWFLVVSILHSEQFFWILK